MQVTKRTACKWSWMKTLTIIYQINIIYSSLKWATAVGWAACPLAPGIFLCRPPQTATLVIEICTKRVSNWGRSISVFSPGLLFRRASYGQIRGGDSKCIGLTPAFCPPFHQKYTDSLSWWAVICYKYFGTPLLSPNIEQYLDMVSGTRKSLSMSDCT